MVLAIRLPPPFMELHPEGAKVGVSGVPHKDGFFAQVKRELPAERADEKSRRWTRALDFMIGFDANGHMTETADGKLGIVTADRVLRVPKPGHILMGTTMFRACWRWRGSRLVLGRRPGGRGKWPTCRARILEHAAEMLVFGTSPHVTAVTEFAGRPVGAGRPGPVWSALSQVFEADLRNPEMLTPVWPR